MGDEGSAIEGSVNQRQFALPAHQTELAGTEQLAEFAGRHGDRTGFADALLARQRWHHGATGSVVATVAFLGLAIGPATEARQLGNSRSMLALAAAGGALMVHDWKDRSVWFAREPGPRAAAA